MILLNEPWREVERCQRRDRHYRIAVWICYTLACVLIGIAVGMLLH